MPHKAPAIDFSQVGAVTTEAVNKLYKGLYEAMEFDAKKLAEKRTEFMSNMEIGQLNQNLQGVAKETVLNTINEFTDKWTDLMIEKEGRLSGTDLVKMRQHQQTVEYAIELTNANQKAFEEAQQTIRGRDGGEYDLDHFNKAKELYINEGKISEDGFLQIRAKDPVLELLQVRRPDRIKQDVDYVWEGGKWRARTKDVYATDEHRYAYILDRMKQDRGFAAGIAERYHSELTLEERQEFVDAAQREGVTPYEAYALSFKDDLWQDSVGSRVDTVAWRRQEGITGSEEEPAIDLIDATPQRLTTQRGYEFAGYDLLPYDLPDLNRNLVGVINTETGQKEDLGPSRFRIIGYDVERDQILVETEREQRPILKGGEPVYKLRHKGARSFRQQGANMTKAEIEDYLSGTGEDIGEFELEQQHEKGRFRTTFALDAKKDEYKKLLDGINLPTKTSRPAGGFDAPGGVRWTTGD